MFVTVSKGQFGDDAVGSAPARTGALIPSVTILVKLLVALGATIGNHRGDDVRARAFTFLRRPGDDAVRVDGRIRRIEQLIR